MKFAWVIERDSSEQSRPEYFTGKLTPALRWSNPGDHSDVCRFSRKEDAERILVSLDPARKHRIAEHGWEDDHQMNRSSPYEPQTDLAKMLLVIVQEIAALAPLAFSEIDVSNALRQADGVKQ